MRAELLSKNHSASTFLGQFDLAEAAETISEPGELEASSSIASSTVWTPTGKSNLMEIIQYIPSNISIYYVIDNRSDF